MKRHLYVGAMFLAALGVLAVGSHVMHKRAVVQAAGGAQAPRFEVDPMWPKPLPNHWLMGNVIGVSVDSKDHIWIIHRQGSLEAMEDYAVANPPGAKRQRGKVESECCQQAPPERQSGAARGRGPGGPPLYHDSLILKFTQDGKFLMKMAREGESHGSN